LAFGVLLALAIVLVPGLRLAHADTPVFTIGNQSDAEATAVSFTVAATGTEPPFSYAITAGSLPAGISLDGASGAIAGTIANGAAQTQGGVYSITITATDSSSPPDSTAASFTWTVTDPVPTINAVGTQTTNEGVAVSLTVIGFDPDGDAPLTWGATGLPTGLVINPGTGLIFGTVTNGAAQTQGGAYSVTITLTDLWGQGSHGFTWYVQDPPPIIGALGPRFNAENTAVSFGVTGSDPDGDSITYSATGLPAGVGINTSTGLVSGTITNGAAQGGSGGVYTVTVYVQDSWGSASTLFFWTVTDPNPVVNPVQSQSNTEGNSVSLQVTATDPDGDTPITYLASGLPPGLSMNSSGLITGTVANNAAQGGAGGVHTVTVTATDPNGFGTGQFTWTINDVTTPDFTDDGARLTQTINELGVPVSLIGTDADGDSPLIFTVVSGSLPPGLTLSAGGSFGGAASGQSRGAYSAQVTVSDGRLTSGSHTLSITVNDVTPPAFTSAPTNAAQTVNEGAGLAPLGATDGDTDPLTFSRTSGTLPPGISLSTNGTFSGVTTMQSAGTYTVTVRVSDGQLFASRVLTITVVDTTLPVFTGAAANTAKTVNEGSGLTAMAATDPDNDPLIFALISGTLPTGITLNADGTFSGVTGPQTAAASPYTVRIRVSDSPQATQSSQVTLVITVTDITPPIFSTALTNTLQTIKEGQGLTALQATDVDKDPLTFTRTSGSLPLGLNLSTNGSFTGLAVSGSAGTYSVTCQVSDGKLMATTNMIITVSRGDGLRTGITVIITIGQGTATINGVASALDAPPFITNGRTMVPLRFISESLGAQVDWNALSRTVTVQGGGNTIILTVGVSTATVNGQARSLEAPPQIVGGRTFVPLRFINESLGAQVNYNSTTRSVTITR
jgi:hypothetical protein